MSGATRSAPQRQRTRVTGRAVPRGPSQGGRISSRGRTRGGSRRAPVAGSLGRAVPRTPGDRGLRAGRSLRVSGDARVTRRPTGQRLTDRAIPRALTPLPSHPLTRRPFHVRGYRLGFGGRRAFTSRFYRPAYGGLAIYGSYFYFPSYNVFDFGYHPYRHYGYYPSYYGYGSYGYRSSYGRGYYGNGPRLTGALRLNVKPGHAQVFVDGYFVGSVDYFDSVLQRLRLEEGPHKIEILAAGYESLIFNVRIRIGDTVTYRGELRPLP